MENMEIHDLMRPVEEFPRISSQLTFFQALEALEKAQDEFLSGKAAQRILLVYDKDDKIVGKLSPMDLVQGLEPNYDRIESLKDQSRYRLNEETLERMKEQFQLWHTPFSELCKKADGVKIENFIKMPSPDHMVNSEDKMAKAFHLFVVGRHDSLFVREEDRIVGLILFSDVYRQLAQAMKQCPMEG
ncbi:MAG TPA: CBS domain-containing protein [Desulfobacteraceae bacterium]|jgi:hypothetical protein|nr:CBS domain-containing protein [Desulfobacteraceae bacterium]